jgi:hypothetical protein
MKNKSLLFALGLITALSAFNMPLKACELKYNPEESAFITDFHDVLVKPDDRVKNAIPIFRAMTYGDQAKFTYRTFQYYFYKLILSKLAPTKFPLQCYEAFALASKDATKDYPQAATAIMNSDRAIPENIDFLKAQKAAGAYMAVCTNLGPESMEYVNQANGKFLSDLCTNQDDTDKTPAIWTPNAKTGLITKNNPRSESYLTLFLRLAACRPDTQKIVVIDDKPVNLAAAQTALSLLQAQNPPVLPDAQIIPILINNPDDFALTVKTALGVSS